MVHIYEPWVLVLVHDHYCVPNKPCLKESGECEEWEGYQLQPPFVDKRGNPVKKGEELEPEEKK